MSLPAGLVVPMGACLATVLTLVITGPIRRVALHLDLTDRPMPHKAHQRPTPYLGGLALVLGCLLPVALLGRPWNAQVVTIVIAAVFVAGLGLADDIVSLSKRSRLAAEALAATVVTLTVQPLAVLGIAWLDTVVTVVWIVVITNSFNLLDNMDAAAASVGTATAAVLGIAALSAGREPIALLMLCLAGGCIGFLAHNRPPARIFMGDAGSLFIGFMLATAALLCVNPGRVGSGAVLLLVTFVATVDTLVVVIDRRRNGRPWHSGGTDHVSHRLRLLGLSCAGVSGVLFFGAAASTTLGVLVATGAIAGWPAFGLGVLGVATAVSLLLTVPIRESSPS